MRIFITGSNGLLGQKLLHTISTETHDLSGCDLAAESLVKDVEHRYHRLDLTDRKSTRKVLQTIEPQIIVHTAAMTGVDKCELEKEKCWQVNVYGTDNIISSAEKIGAKVIFISSDYVFDGEHGPYQEEDKPNPVNYYGRSKLAAENLLRGSGIEWVIVRTIVLYGTGVNLRANFVTWLLDRLRACRPVHIVTDQWGNTTLVDDLAGAIERIILLERSGIYHIGGREFVTRYEFAVRIARFFNLEADLIHPVTTEELSQPAKRPLRSGLETEKAERDLFMSFHDIAQSLAIFRDQESASAVRKDDLRQREKGRG